MSIKAKEGVTGSGLVDKGAICGHAFMLLEPGRSSAGSSATRGPRMTLRFPISISSITPNGFTARAFSTSLNVTMTRLHFSTSQMMGAK
ncbi:hypothetical protein FOFC_13048 [Fusarium oxysporum]|nr:hypothetical protein FOFC_13048 [Fusarium oxysporum]